MDDYVGIKIEPVLSMSLSCDIVTDAQILISDIQQLRSGEDGKKSALSNFYNKPSVYIKSILQPLCTARTS